MTDEPTEPLVFLNTCK